MYCSCTIITNNQLQKSINTNIHTSIEWMAQKHMHVSPEPDFEAHGFEFRHRFLDGDTDLTAEINTNCRRWKYNRNLQQRYPRRLTSCPTRAEAAPFVHKSNLRPSSCHVITALVQVSKRAWRGCRNIILEQLICAGFSFHVHEHNRSNSALFCSFSISTASCNCSNFLLLLSPWWSNTCGTTSHASIDFSILKSKKRFKPAGWDQELELKGRDEPCALWCKLCARSNRT